MNRPALIKNKIDLEYNSLLQERNTILIALTGVPLTIVNVLIIVMGVDARASLLWALVSFLSFLYLKISWDRKLKTKLTEIDRLMKK
jgi:hypothetical protein